MVWFSGGVFLCFSGDSEGRVLVFLGGVCDCLCFCAEWVIFGRGGTLGGTERGDTFWGGGGAERGAGWGGFEGAVPNAASTGAARAERARGAGGGWLMGGNVPFLWSWI